MAQITFDASSVAPEAPRELLPPDRYPVQIVQSEMRATKAGDGQMLWIEMDIIDGPYRGRKIWDQLNLVNRSEIAQEIAQRRLSAICHAVGQVQVTDSHVRSTEPSALGWVVALMCYEPISRGLWPAWFAYDAGRPWGHWLAGSPLLYQAWGLLILLLTAVYAWATVSFGLRFSNLTHRGIITSGPYRWLRHPAYLAKNRFGLSDTLELAWPTLAAGIPYYAGAAADAGTSPTTAITQGA